MSEHVRNVVAGMGEYPAAWANAWAKAPAVAHYKGATFGKNNATSAEQRAWFLAAAALESPEALVKMAPYQVGENGEGHYFLDADPSALQAARAAYSSAHAAVGALQNKISAYKRERARWVAEKQKAESSTFKDLGSVLSLGIANAAGAAFAQSKIGWYDDQIEQMQLKLADAQSAEQSAKADLQTAQTAYDDANRQIRQQEEQARQQALADQQAQQLAAQQAQQRDTTAAGASQQYWGLPSNGMPFPGQDASLSAGSQGPWDPFGSDSGMLGDDGAFGLDLRGTGDYVDTYGGGDAEEAMSRLHREGRDLPGLTRHDSAWCFDRYYGNADPDYMGKMFGTRRLMANSGMDADAPQQAQDANGAFSAIGKILATILQEAPAIVSAANPPKPSDVPKNAPGEGDKAGAALNTVLDKTGVNAVLDAKAEKAGRDAGERAGKEASSGLFIAALLIGGAIFLTHNKAA